MKISEINSVFKPLKNSNRNESFDTEFENLIDKVKNTDTLDDKKLKDACNEFEAYFIKNIFKQMRRTMPKNDLYPSSNAKEIYEEMLDEERANNIAQSGDIGLAKMLYEQLRKTNN